MVCHSRVQCRYHAIRATSQSDATGHVHLGGVSPMTHLQDLASWVDANLTILERHGKVSFTFGPTGTDNPSAHLLVAVSHDEDVELLVW